VAICFGSDAAHDRGDHLAARVVARRRQVARACDKWAEPSFAFETAYYIGVLGFLWIHYYQDHFLFTKPEAIIP